MLKHFFKLCFIGIFGILLAACSLTTNDPSVGKADFAKLQQWSDSVELQEKKLETIQPNSEDEAVQLLDSLFNQAISQAKALDLHHSEVIILRDKVVEGLGYQRLVMRSMISPKYTSENSEAFYIKAENLAEEVEQLYEKLEKEFAE